MNHKQKIKLILANDRALRLLQDTTFFVTEENARNLAQNWSLIFKDCPTHPEKIKRMKEIYQLEIRYIIHTSNPDWSAESINNLSKNFEIHFAGCHSRQDIEVRLQEIHLTNLFADLIEDAGLDWPYEYARNLVYDWEKVFNGCKTREDAIERLIELSPVVTIA